MYHNYISRLASNRNGSNKFILTMVLSEPSQFKWAALASYLSIIAGGVTYLVYVKKERGHVWHHPAGDMFPLIRRKAT